MTQLPAALIFCLAFACSVQGQSAEAQERFTLGVRFLHSFEYHQAPGFAMAYWGEAHDLQRARLVRPGSGVRPHRAEPPGRDKAYLDAVEVLYGEDAKEQRDVAYATAIQSIHQAYPGDHDAAAFSALALIGTCHRGRDSRSLALDPFDATLLDLRASQLEMLAVAAEKLGD